MDKNVLIYTITGLLLVGTCLYIILKAPKYRTWNKVLWMGRNEGTAHIHLMGTVLISMENGGEQEVYEQYIFDGDQMKLWKVGNIKENTARPDTPSVKKNLEKWEAANKIRMRMQQAVDGVDTNSTPVETDTMQGGVAKAIQIDALHWRLEWVNEEGIRYAYTIEGIKDANFKEVQLPEKNWYCFTWSRVQPYGAEIMLGIIHTLTGEWVWKEPIKQVK